MRTKAVCGWSLMASVASKLVGLNRRVMEIRHPPNLLCTLLPLPLRGLIHHLTHGCNYQRFSREALPQKYFSLLEHLLFSFLTLSLEQIRKIMPVLRKMDILNFILDLNFEIVRSFLCLWLNFSLHAWCDKLEVGHQGSGAFCKC